MWLSRDAFVRLYARNRFPTPPSALRRGRPGLTLPGPATAGPPAPRNRARGGIEDSGKAGKPVFEIGPCQ